MINKINFDYTQEFREYMAANVGLDGWAKRLSDMIRKELGVSVNVQISERFDFVFTGDDLALSRVYIDILEALGRGKMTKRFTKRMQKHQIQVVIVFGE